MIYHDNPIHIATFNNDIRVMKYLLMTEFINQGFEPTRVFVTLTLIKT